MKKEVPLSRAHRLINHGPVVLVSSVSEDGKPNVLAVAWVTPVCQEPPMAAVSIAKGHYSHECIENNGTFVINVPHPGMVENVMKCGRISGRGVDKFKQTGLTPMPAEKVEAPLIEECIGHLECRVWQVADAGDHTLFMGSVLTAWVEEALFDERWKIEEDVVEGLHHLGGRHFAVSSRRISVED